MVCNKSRLAILKAKHQFNLSPISSFCRGEYINFRTKFSANKYGKECWQDLVISLVNMLNKIGPSMVP